MDKSEDPQVVLQVLNHQSGGQKQKFGNSTCAVAICILQMHYFVLHSLVKPPPPHLPIGDKEHKIKQFFNSEFYNIIVYNKVAKKD